MPPEGPPLDKVVDQVRQETGARMVVLGETHNTQNTIQYLRDSLPDLKAKGVSTLYLELPANIQPMLDKALQGDEKSQRDLRLNYERWWGSYGGTEGAQQRYDMLFEANKAGIRVKCADMDELGDSMQRFNNLGNKDAGVLDARLAIGNNVIANNIQKMDDGKGAILLIGSAHTFKANAEDHVEEILGKQEQIYNSIAGGVDAQLNDKGVRTASVDFTNREGNTEFRLERSENTKSNDYVIHAPYEEAAHSPYNMSGGYRVGWNRLANVFEQAGINAEVSGDKASAALYAKASKDMATLPRLLDDPQYLKLSSGDQARALMQAMENVSIAVRPAEQKLQDPVLTSAAAALHSEFLLKEGEKDTPDGMDAIKTLMMDNQDLHLSGASKMWKKPGAPLAGEESATGLRKEWKAAQEATTPLDQPQEKPQIPQPQAAPVQRQVMSMNYS